MVHRLESKASIHIGRSGLLEEADGIVFADGDAFEKGKIRNMETMSTYVGEKSVSLDIYDSNATPERAVHLMEAIAIPLLNDANDRLTKVVHTKMQSALQKEQARISKEQTMAVYGEEVRRRKILFQEQREERERAERSLAIDAAVANLGIGASFHRAKSNSPPRPV